MGKHYFIQILQILQKNNLFDIEFLHIFLNKKPEDFSSGFLLFFQVI